MGRALSLVAQGHPLASPAEQLNVLRSAARGAPFSQVAGDVRAARVDVLQVNVGKRCNQTCGHCHVDAGPDRVEVMGDAVVDAVLSVLERERIPTLDITGGAPELHPRFDELVRRGRAAGARVIDRCNLTILTTPRFKHLPRFLADHRVEVVCSLPSAQPDRTDAQRGDGVYDKSLEALRALNAAGYGVPGTGLELVVVSNPTGAFLPPPQTAYETDVRAALGRLGIQVSRVLVLANMPIARFLAWLERTGNTARYLEKVVGAHNPAAVAGLMCRTHVSVSWDGRLFDCDFNQMLELPVAPQAPATIFDWDTGVLAGRQVVTDAHCFGCTAGHGSSCGGALTHGVMPD